MLVWILWLVAAAIPARAVSRRSNSDGHARTTQRAGMSPAGGLSKLGGISETTEIAVFEGPPAIDLPQTNAATLAQTAGELASPRRKQASGSVAKDDAADPAAAQQTLTRSFDGLMALPSGRSLYVDAENLTEAPVYVLLHGLGRDSASLGRIALRLKRRGFGVVGIDLHGHGRTPRQHGDAIDYRHNVEDVAGVIETLGLERIRIVGHSYGGFIALMLGAHPALASRLERISAIVPYVQHLGRRAAEEAVNNFDRFASLNPLHDLAMAWQRAGFPTPWSMAWTMGVAATRAWMQAAVGAWTQAGIDYLRRTRGEGAGASTAGIPDDIISDPPLIPRHVLVDVILGDPGSLAPNDMRHLFAHFNSDEMAFEFVEALRGRGIHARILRARGSHMVVYERPDEITELVAGR